MRNLYLLIVGDGQATKRYVTIFIAVSVMCVILKTRDAESIHMDSCI